jgi:uroporphyrinogen decarboxylase
MEWERHAAAIGLSSLAELLDYLGNTIKIYVPDWGDIKAGDGAVRLPSIWGVPAGFDNTYTDTAPRPLARAETIAEVDAYAWPTNDDWDWAGLRKRLAADTTHARMGPGWMPVFSRLCELFGMEQAMVNLLVNRPVAEAAIAHLDEFYTEFYARMLDSCGDQLEILGLGDDFAGNKGLLINPDLWRRYFKPLYAKWMGMARSRGLVTLMHSCGNNLQVLPDLIDSGLDCWQTVQTHLPGQNPERLKREFGRHLTFAGAVDTTNVLGSGTPQEIRDHVRRQILALGEGGGYICGPDHTVMEGVPTENVLAMCEAVAEFRSPGYTTGL